MEISVENALGSLNEVETKNAPAVLYYSGNPDLMKKSPKVSIVGSRKVSDFGFKRARKLAELLVERNVTVVSGLAEGVDTAALTSAVECGGKTIAVIGTPLDKSYPASNKELQALIARDHLLVSQFPIGFPGGRKNFPMRNRTMALISDATVIVEAGEGSGTLHQGWEALRLGRPLFILESAVKNPNLTWPAEFISFGAKSLTKEGLDELIELLPPAPREELSSLSL